MGDHFKNFNLYDDLSGGYVELGEYESSFFDNDENLDSDPEYEAKMDEIDAKQRSKIWKKIKEDKFSHDSEKQDFDTVFEYGVAHLLWEDLKEIRRLRHHHETASLAGVLTEDQ